MRKLVVPGLLLLVLMAWVMPAAAIVYGDMDGNGHPNVGLISISAPNNSSTQIPLCSGTLIAPRVFLTAGHCTDFLESHITDGELTPEGVKVSFDPDDARINTLLDVAEIHTHQDYKNSTNSNPRDVGVLILVDKVTDSIEPAPLADKGFLDRLKAAGKLRQGSKGAEFVVVGYGATEDPPPGHFKSSDGKRRVATSEFLNLRKVWLEMSQNQATDNAGTCFGDSGGPTFWEADGSKILVAVTSWGDSQCVATSINYRTDIADTLDFVLPFLD